MQLLQTLAGDVFAEGIPHVLLGKENAHARKGIIVGSHAVVLQVGNGLHALLFHILLREHDGELFGAVAAEIEEDNYVSFLDATIYFAANQRLHELVRVLVLLRVRIVTGLHTFHHISHFAPFSVYQQVISQFNAIPMLVTVHGVVPADDGRHRWK